MLLSCPPRKILRQSATVEPVGLHSLSWGFGDHRWRGDQARVGFRHQPIIQSVARRSSLVGKGHLLIGKVLAHVIHQMLHAIGHTQGADKSLMIGKGHRDAPLVDVQSSKHFVIGGLECFAFHHGASLLQRGLLPPLYRRTLDLSSTSIIQVSRNTWRCIPPIMCSPVNLLRPAAKRFTLAVSSSRKLSGLRPAARIVPAIISASGVIAVDRRRIEPISRIHRCSKCKSVKVNEGIGCLTCGSSKISAGVKLRPKDLQGLFRQHR